MLEGFTIPVPNATVAAGMVLAFLAGAACPTYYAQERFRGFGRALVDKLPYRPPPGMKEEQALEAAMESAEEADVEMGESSTPNE